MTANWSRRKFLLRLAGIPVLACAGRALAGNESGGEAYARRLRSTVRFENPRNRNLEDQRFWCYLPMNIAARQHVRQVDASMVHRVLDDELGHRVLEIGLGTVSPLAQKLVTITVDIDVEAQTRPQALPQPSDWLSAERFIESDDEGMREAARSLRRESDAKTASAIFEWVRSRMTYAGYVADDLGARYALVHGRGDCTEYADLVVALARANGIPARMVGGYVTTQDASVRATDYHNWAEVFLDGAWRIVDAQKGNWLPPFWQYIAYRIYRDTATNPVGLAHRYRLEGELLVSF